MATRTFVLEGESKRFWDITWDALAVEITSGKWGTDGRVREAWFETLAARDAFVAAEIKKVEKKGYCEIFELAPAPDLTKSTAAAVATLRRLVEARCRPAWLPTFELGSSGETVVRGPMTLDRDEAWPACSCCGEPMTGLFELDLSTVPAEHLRHDSVVQLFMCEAWQLRVGESNVTVCTTKGGTLARRHRRGGAKRALPGQLGASHVLSDWTRYEEAPPSAGELHERFESASQDVIDDLLRSAGASLEREAIDDGEYRAVVRALGLEARNVHKLAGFPTFVQEYETPFAHQIFQIEDAAPFDANFGDIGAGHLLLGANDGIQFTWSSH